MTPTTRTELRQMAERGTRDWAVIASILDAGFLANVGFCVQGQPFVLPMLYGRESRSLYLHGAAASRLMGALGGGAPVCATVTLVDGLVLARSAFHHSMNYRSVSVFGEARVIAEPRRKIEALKRISEHLIAGRWADVRGPNKAELTITTVLELSMDEASSKVRAGPVGDEEGDYGWPAWAGVLPLRLTPGAPEPDARMLEPYAAPEYLRDYAARLRAGA